MPKFVVKQTEQTEEPTVELWLETIGEYIYLRAQQKGKTEYWNLLRIDGDGSVYRLSHIPDGLGFVLDKSRLFVK